MLVSMRTLLLACLCACLCLPSLSQSSTTVSKDERRTADQNEDPPIILEVGAAMSWNTAGGAAIFAPNLAAEITPIEGKLELEAGVSPFFTRDATEWDTDFLFKKPWTLSRRAEFMLGVGPGWTYLKQGGTTATSFSGEVAGDFMFWPTGRHHLGWFLEPAYEYSFAAGHEKSLGMTAGLLIGVGAKHAR